MDSNINDNISICFLVYIGIYSSAISTNNETLFYMKVTFSYLNQIYWISNLKFLLIL